MSDPRGYVLGQSARAARRLEIQDAHFADVSELLLDDLALRRDERVVELGCGAGSFSRRVLRRLGAGGVLVGVDCTQGLLTQAAASLVSAGPARFEPVLADIAAWDGFPDSSGFGGLGNPPHSAQPGSWLDGADVVVVRTVLHHVPMAELLLGRLRAALRPGTRLGLIEPDFRTPLGRIAHLEATGRTELEPLRVWAVAINQLYLANRISPQIGATMAQTLELAGYRNVRAAWCECPTSALAIENMLMFYDEVGERLTALGILSADEIARQQQLLGGLAPATLPAVWGSYRVVCDA